MQHHTQSKPPLARHRAKRPLLNLATLAVLLPPRVVAMDYEPFQEDHARFRRGSGCCGVRSFGGCLVRSGSKPGKPMGGGGCRAGRSGSGLCGAMAFGFPAVEGATGNEDA